MGSDLAERLEAMIGMNGTAITCNGRSTREMCNDILEAAARIRELEAALKPITMPDVRLRVGEHKLTAHEVLSVCNDILQDRAARQALGGDIVDQSEIRAATRIRELEALLKPFAEAADAAGTYWQSYETLSDVRHAAAGLTFGHLRAARQALGGDNG